MFKETFLSEDHHIVDRIEHGCDIFVSEDGELEQYYNYLIYHFSGVGHSVWARAYLDDLAHATLYGARSADDQRLIEPRCFETEKGRQIVGYLQRRYPEVRLGAADPYIFPDML